MNRKLSIYEKKNLLIKKDNLKLSSKKYLKLINLNFKTHITQNLNLPLPIAICINCLWSILISAASLRNSHKTCGLATKAIGVRYIRTNGNSFSLSPLSPIHTYDLCTQQMIVYFRLDLVVAGENVNRIKVQYVYAHWCRFRLFVAINLQQINSHRGAICICLVAW